MNHKKLLALLTILVVTFVQSNIVSLAADKIIEKDNESEYGEVISLSENDIHEDVVINEQSFPDDNFRAIIRSKADKNNDGILSDEEIKRVNVLSMENEDIQSLKGIELFTNLLSLDASNNKIKNADFSNNLYLWEIYLTSNQLTSLDVSKCSELAGLYIGNNPELKKFDVSNNTKLQQLHCQNCGLNEIDISNCPDVTRLVISYNDIEEIDLSNNQNINFLVCSSTKINDCDFSYLKNLETLEINNNSIKELDLSKYENLVKLYANDCQIESFKNCQSRKIELLYIGGDNLTDVDVSGFPNLLNLSVRDNKLTKIDVSNNIKLEALYIYGNSIENLDISQNKALIKLSANDNNISQLDITNNKYLKHLFVDNNKLEKIDLSNNTKLETLHIENNLLNEIVLPTNPGNMKDLSCQGNELSSINLRHMGKLTTLKLENNRLNEVQLGECTSLITPGGEDNIFLGNQKDGQSIVAFISVEQYLNGRDSARVDEMVGHENVRWMIHSHKNTLNNWQYGKQDHYLECEYDDEIIAREAHQPEEYVEPVAATCMTNGEPGYYKCKCGYFEDKECKNYIKNIDSWLYDNRTPYANHEVKVVKGKAVTCTQDGVGNYYECICGIYEDESCIKPITDLEVWKKEHVIKANGHVWDRGQIVVDPSFTGAGEKQYTCFNCGETKKEAIPRIEFLEVPVKGKISAAQAVSYLTKGTKYEGAKKVKFVTDNKKAATVSKKGIFSAKKTGRVLVTAMVKNSEGKYENACSFYVMINNTEITTKYKIISEKEVLDLNTLVNNLPAGYKVSFTMSDKMAKKVEFNGEAGTIKPIKSGKCTVRCTITQNDNVILRKNIVVTVKLSEDN